MAAPDPLLPPDHVAQLRADTAAFAATLRTDTLDRAVAGCPGWDLRALAGHLGFVHRWATAAARSAAPPDPAAIGAAPDAAEDLADWIVTGGSTLADVLAALAPDAPTWHPFPAPMVAGVWQRRQAQETSVHRWDAQSAVGVDATIEPPMAADGVGEYFEVILGRKFARDGGSPPARGDWLHVAATDVAAEWWVRTEGGRVQVERSATEPAAASLRGRAEDLQLVLFARRPAAVLTSEGDPTLADAWLAIGGN
jgi:uncharacterized protein (TIGR03083 family)